MAAMRAAIFAAGGRARGDNLYSGLRDADRHGTTDVADRARASDLTLACDADWVTLSATQGLATESPALSVDPARLGTG
jgi:hypothetical protein